MSSKDRTSFTMVALGLMLATACGGEPLTNGQDDLDAEGFATDAVEQGSVADDVTADDHAVVEKGGSILSGSTNLLNFGTLAATETRSLLWVISATQIVEDVTAESVGPFVVSPSGGCPRVDPDDPTIRRCVFTVTFLPPGNAGTFEATLTASDSNGNSVSVDVIGVGEAFIPF
jgi:hypothetical protein